MDIEHIKATWEELAGRRVEFVGAFYKHLFERYPDYRRLFPQQLDPQLERMTEMISALALHSEHIDLIEPYLENVGFAHRATGIRTDDVQNFVTTFVDTLGEMCGDRWTPARAEAWSNVFSDIVVPLFEEGLERGRDENPHVRERSKR